MALFSTQEMHTAQLEHGGGRERALAGLAALAAHALLAVILLLGLVHQVVKTKPKVAPTLMVNVFNARTQTASPAPPSPKQVHVAPVTAMQPEIVIQAETRISPTPTASPVSVTATSTLATAMAMAPSGGAIGAGPRASGAGGGGAGGYDISAYLARVAAHIQGYLRLPYLPSGSVRNSNPTVMIHLIWTRDGRVAKVEVMKSSEHSRIDEAAVAAVERAQPLPPFPPELKGERINGRIPVMFIYRWIPPDLQAPKPVQQPTSPTSVVQSQE
jgi:protein TonB